MMEVKLTRYPTEEDWVEAKRRAIGTEGKKKVITPPTYEWKQRSLRARHSHIRYLQFSFNLTIPYYISTHLARHVHAQPYISSQRNDRQNKYDRKAARQDELVYMIWDMSAEELMTIANKRLCKKADPDTQWVVEKMCEMVIATNPEFKGMLVPNCVYMGGECHEMRPCYDE